MKCSINGLRNGTGNTLDGAQVVDVRGFDGGRNDGQRVGFQAHSSITQSIVSGPVGYISSRAMAAT